MCGIAGIIGLNNRDYGNKMLSKLSHRGPDSDGLWVSPEGDFPALFCHTRLSIIDLSDNSAQPFESKDKRYVLVYNGEIYNFLELKIHLEASGCRFQTNGDTEILLLGILKEGISFLERCNGMWAFCLWDRFEKKAIFSRDRFGVKPLYYTFLDSNILAFSSEMKGLTPFLNSINPACCIDTLFSNNFIYESTSQCSIDNIIRFKPAFSYSYAEGEMISSRWFDALDHINPVDNSYVEQVNYWQHLFIDSVAIRMRSDVRIGTALSGGLDSSCVMATMKHVSDLSAPLRSASDWQNGYCSSFKGSSLDEVKWATMVADSLGCKLKVASIDPLNCGWSIDDSLAQCEDPYLTLPLPMLATYKAIKSDGISVTLDGHGADELFSGYGHIMKALECVSTRSEFNEIIAIDESTRTGILSPNAKLRKRAYAKQLLKKWLLANKFTSVYFRWILLSTLPEHASELTRIRSHPNYLSMDVFSQQLYELFVLTVLPTLLRNYDRYSMASGVEVRMPFMDWRLVCYTFSLPWRSKVGGGFTKRIQRDAMIGILTNDVRTRRDKIGWNAPANDWFKGPLVPYVEELLSTTSFSKYHNKASLSWSAFQCTHQPTYGEGQQLWSNLLPLAYLKCLSSNIWK